VGGSSPEGISFVFYFEGSTLKAYTIKIRKNRKALPSYSGGDAGEAAYLDNLLIYLIKYYFIHHTKRNTI